MMCQNCGKNPATTHIKTIVNGKLAEYEPLLGMCKGKRLQESFFNFDDMGTLISTIVLGSFHRCADRAQ